MPPTLLPRFDALPVDALPPPGTWRQWPAAGDRAAWERVLTPARRAWILAHAEAALVAGIPALPATLLLDCARTANRVRGEAVHFGRRKLLAHAVLAWAATREARWLDFAVDAIWALCEESAWTVPAHYNHHPQPLVKGLPRHDQPVVDLFAAETAAVLADALDVLGDDLDALDPAVRPRVVHELRRRVLDPIADGTAWWWLSGRNNWTPWIAANAGRAALVAARDDAQQRTIVRILLGACERFAAGYGPDGACDEGMRYWGVAFGTLFVFLDLLQQASGGRIGLLDHPLFTAQARFPLHAHLAGRYFLPFADNTGLGTVRRALGWRVGERLGVPELQALAWLERHDWRTGGTPEPLHDGITGSALQSLLWELFWLPADDARPAAPAASVRSWLPDLQVLVSRSAAASPFDPAPRWVLAVKGGHNGENHNHNDVGCVHLLRDGRPWLIDPGIEAYTARTFSAERYRIWCIRGSGHNAPVINGHEQHSGREHAAQNVRTVFADDHDSFSADLAACYPAEAGVKGARRMVVLDRRDGSVRISDEITGEGALEATTHWFAAVDPATMTLEHAPDTTVTVTEWPLEDPGLRASWGTDRLWRISATRRGDRTLTLALTVR